MTEQEAIEVLTDKNTTIRTKKCDDVAWRKLKPAIDAAVTALEKQIPKRPDYEGDGYADGEIVYDTWICPCCEERYEIGYDEYDYCPNCGQHIEVARFDD